MLFSNHDDPTLIQWGVDGPPRSIMGLFNDASEHGHEGAGYSNIETSVDALDTGKPLSGASPCKSAAISVEANSLDHEGDANSESEFHHNISSEPSMGGSEAQQLYSSRSDGTSALSLRNTTRLEFISPKLNRRKKSINFESPIALAKEMPKRKGKGIGVDLQYYCDTNRVDD